MRGSVHSAFTASASPCSTFSTPGGPPASQNSSASRTAVEGSRSDGLSTTALPQASAGPSIHNGTMAGKLNGVIAAVTPSGWRRECMSIPRATLSLNSPLMRCGMPVANSTTSSPRCSSPRASATTLPCSRLIRCASSSAWARHNSRHRKSTRARSSADRAPHAGAAAAASAMTVSISTSSASGTCAATAPVEGSYTGAVRVECASWRAPATTCGMRGRVMRQTEEVRKRARGTARPKCAQTAGGQTSASITAVVTSRVVAVPPRSGVRGPPPPTTRSIARTIRSCAAVRPR